MLEWGCVICVAGDVICAGVSTTLVSNMIQKNLLKLKHEWNVGQSNCTWQWEDFGWSSKKLYISRTAKKNRDTWLELPGCWLPVPRIHTKMNFIQIHATIFTSFYSIYFIYFWIDIIFFVLFIYFCFIYLFLVYHLFLYLLFIYSIFIYLFFLNLLVVCLSTNGERASNYTIVKWLILTSNTQATKIKSITYAVKGFQCHSNRSPQLFELKK